MSYKTKSFLYFASFAITALAYYNIENADIAKNTELAENTVENVSTQETLN